jgi:hypothetical protein
MSFVNWLSNYQSLKPPRTRRTCDYCNQPQRALVMRFSSKLRITTCNAHCEDAYLVAVYRKSSERFHVFKQGVFGVSH